jgi:diketogulonate reductase-like aldo/keto reductase
MKHKKIGRDGAVISAIGQGCMGIGGYFSKNDSRKEEELKALGLGIELGMTFIDTAEVYGNGCSEEIIGEGIAGKRDSVFIATKVSPEHISCHNLLAAAEGSIKRMGIECIDLYQIHWPNPAVPIDETMRAMADLIQAGKIRYAGVCNFSLKELQNAERALPSDGLVSVQAEYNLFDRTIEHDILPYCEKKGIITIAYSPLDQGRMCDGTEKAEILRGIAQKYERMESQIALNWLAAHSSVIAIPKATNRIHIRQNAAATDFELEREDFEKIQNAFVQEVVFVETDRVRVVADDLKQRQVYRTVEEAKENKWNFVPGPVDLAQQIQTGEMLKPVRVVAADDVTGRYQYNLIEGRNRYWAWVIAHNGTAPIPAYVRKTS